MDNFRDLSIKRAVCVIGIQKALRGFSLILSVCKQIQFLIVNINYVLLWVNLIRQCSPWCKKEERNFPNNCISPKCLFISMEGIYNGLETVLAPNFFC